MLMLGFFLRLVHQCWACQSRGNGQAKLLVVTTNMVRSHLCACAVTSVIAVTAAIVTPLPAAAPGGGLGQA